MFIKTWYSEEGNTKLRKNYAADAGTDIILDYDLIIPASKTIVVPLGIGVKIPYNFMGLILPRSSVASRGIISPPCPIDAGYDGEVKAVLTNATDGEVIIKKDTGLVQIVVIPFLPVAFMSADEIRKTGMQTYRGDHGFGSTNV